MKWRRTAAEVAAKLGVTPRTVRNYLATPRKEYEATAKERRRRAAELRARGLAWAEVGLELGVSATAARLLALRHVRAQAESRAATPPVFR